MKIWERRYNPGEDLLLRVTTEGIFSSTDPVNCLDLLIYLIDILQWMILMTKTTCNLGM